MKKYPAAHWEALGSWVNVARHQADYADTKKWADAVGRSTRMLLGLERGEPVGAKTLEAIAEALGVTNWSLFEILDKGQADWASSSGQAVEDARKRYEDETGLEADDANVTLLGVFSDGELLAEIGRRLATRPVSRSERRLRKVAESWPSDIAALEDEQDPPGTPHD